MCSKLGTISKALICSSFLPLTYVTFFILVEKTLMKIPPPKNKNTHHQKNKNNKHNTWSIKVRSVYRKHTKYCVGLNAHPTFLMCYCQCLKRQIQDRKNTNTNQICKGFFYKRR